MKVLFRLKGRIETINNVSVDDKCFPLVEGVHPYSDSSRYTSPLTQKSAIWFKTLVLEAVYVDCDRGHIFWSPVMNEDPVQWEFSYCVPDLDTLLRRRRKSTYSADPDFVKGISRPLFDDCSLYDLDSSFREMMAKCYESVNKFFKKAIKAKEFHNIVANLLHVYILPTITFSDEDLYALSRARCLTEERLELVENSITMRTEVISTHLNCLVSLKESFLSREDIDRESCLKGFKTSFLIVFLRKIKEDVNNKNLDLLAAQNKVNWAKKQNESPLDIKQYQTARNKLFEEVKFLIRVREALTCAVSKNESGRKRKKKETEDECFQDVFIELDRRLETENEILQMLCTDKVNICATREAILVTVEEIGESKRDSGRSTKFVPDDFADYHFGTTEVNDQWLTFDERVSKVLENADSTQSKIHTQGCGFLKSQIDVALSEFKLTMVGQEQVSAESPTASNRRTGVVVSKDAEMDLFTYLPSAQAVKQIQALSRRDELKGDFRLGSQTLDSLNFFENYFSDESDPVGDEPDQLRDEPDQVGEDSNCPDSRGEAEPEVTMRQKTRPVGTHMSPHAEFLAFRAMMTSVERVKAMIKSHFNDVIKCFQRSLASPEMERPALLEQKELLWKAYERFFCQEMLSDLFELYSTALVPASMDAHKALSATSLQDILEGDQLLDLIFGPPATGNISVGSPCSRSTASSLTRTISGLSLDDMRHCSLADLYTMANKDSSRICDRIARHPETYQCADLTTAFTDSGDSVTSADLFQDEGICSNSSGPSPTSTLDRDEKAGAVRDSSIEVDIISESQAETCPQQTEKSECSATEPDRHPPAASAEAAATADSQIDTSQSLPQQQAAPIINDFDEEPSLPYEDAEDLSFPAEAPSTGLTTELQKKYRVFIAAGTKKDPISMLQPLLFPFREQVKKCVGAKCFLDKVRYVSRAVLELNSYFSSLYGHSHQSACDDIITMLVLALSQLPHELFVGLYINMRLVSDIMPSFLSGTLWEYNLVCVVAAYDFLFSKKVCCKVARRFPSSFTRYG